MKEVNVFELEENYLYGWSDYEEHKKIAPKELVEICDTAPKEGIPTAYGKHPDIGWFVVMSGQGPFIAWQEIN